MRRNTTYKHLFASTIIAGAVLSVGVVSNAAAQAPVATSTGATGSPGSSSDVQNPLAPTDTGAQPAGAVSEVVVTGSLLRHKLSDTDAPITTLSADELSDRGITTVATAIQSIADNGSSALTTSFTARGAFAAGASAASLRGLTSAATLVLIDGLRTADYPLADDGVRNFVDLNTIPDVIIDRIETLKDGASSTYGADAVAGVVNVITKKTYEGFMSQAEGGFTQGGGAGENKFEALIGHGNLARDGYNVYLGVEYEHDDSLYANARGYPYNSSDQSRNCGISNGLGTVAAGAVTCGENGVQNGLQADGSFLGVGSTTVATFRAVDPATNTPIGNYTLAPGATCGSLTPITITPAQAALGGATGITVPTTLCQQDLNKQYEELEPDQKRFSLTLRGTKDLGEHAQAYFTASYYNDKVYSVGEPASIRNETTPGQLGYSYSTAGSPGITIPALLPNGTLNPNDPFAAQGEAATINYRFGDIPSYSQQYDQTYRIAAGVQGDFNLFGGWHYNLDLTGTDNYLVNTQAGDIYVANLITAVNDGTYNFINPSLNSAAIRNFIAPTDVQRDESKLFQIQGSLTRDLIQLPGGQMSLALTGTARYESIYNPSANPDVAGEPTDKYFSINPFGVIGSRDVEAVAFEVDAPVVKQLDIDLSGRYDTYSTGQSNFSPKIGAKFTPIQYFTLRSTYSQGFRIPSFAESNSLPSTGYITYSAPTSFLAAHNNDGYGQNYSLGVTTEGTAGLKPEKTENFTVGLVFDPIRQLSFSMDFYRIKIRDVIQSNSANAATAEADYYAGTPLPVGYTAIASGVLDPNDPTGKAELGFIQYGFVNAGVETTSGYDFGATANFTLPYGVKYSSSFDGNYVLELNLKTDGVTEHYAGSLGPYINVAAGGTPKFKANWQNTLQYGPALISLTAYFTDGYDEEAEDDGGVTGDCVGGVGGNLTYLDGTTPIRCKAKPFWDFDLHTSYDIRKQLTVYMDVQNLFNKVAPYDPDAEYGDSQYNSTFNNAGIIGRFFKFGVRAAF
ncbi:MAG: TonB-dependent receptor domain-containing protein [Caulobacteraceae bacterium]